jgi:hypothetical protein
MRSLALALALAAACAGCSGAPEESGAQTFPAEPLATVQSDARAFTVAVRTAPTQPPTRGRLTVEYTVTAGPTEGVALSVQPWMPDMGHGASTEPSVEAMGGGRFVVSGVDLFMPGRWELRTTITGTATDDVSVPLQIP